MLALRQSLRQTLRLTVRPSAVAVRPYSESKVQEEIKEDKEGWTENREVSARRPDEAGASRLRRGSKPKSMAASRAGGVGWSLFAGWWALMKETRRCRDGARGEERAWGETRVDSMELVMWRAPVTGGLLGLNVCLDRARASTPRPERPELGVPSPCVFL